MSWQAWSLRDWNRALVNAIFFDQERIGIPVSRINASNAFLAGCTGDPACRPGDARACFVRSFGKTSAEVKKHFVAAGHGLAKSGYPTLVAPLYLTLLAASADESTYDLGNFRDRFAEIVLPVEVSNVNFAQLPAMWTALAEWSRKRYRASKDCRILVLPPPPPSRYNKLIGCSKQLAFPGHRDEIRLARLLSEQGLASDVDPIPEAVQLAVLRGLGSFTEAFGQEFRTFSDLLVQARHGEAALTPFWGAVSDITWQYAKAEARTSGSYRLVLDVADPHEPALYLLADERGRDRLGHSCQVRRVPAQENIDYLVERPGGLAPEPAWLARLARIHNLERPKPWQGLLSGCVAFFPDPLGAAFASDGSYYEDAPVCLLLRAEFIPVVARRAMQYNLKHSILDVGDIPRAWKIVHVESASRGSMRALADVLPGMPHGVAGMGWNRPRPRLSGGAWSGQALLLNPASNPIARMDGARTGTYEVLSEGARVLVAGQLLQVDENGFQVPHGSLAGLQGATTVRYVLEGGVERGTRGEVRASVLGGVPSSPLAGPREPGAWLVDGAAGCLAQMLPLAGHAIEAVRSDRQQAAAVHPFLSAGGGEGKACARRDGLDELPTVLGWLRDALHLRFQSRSTLPHGEVLEYVKGAAHAAGVASRDVWRLLYAGGWLVQAARRTAPYSLSMAAPRTIALVGSSIGPVARIAGMLGQAEVARLCSMLLPAERASYLCIDGPGLSIGAVEVELGNPGRLNILAEALGLQILDRNTYGTPLATTVDSCFVPGASMAGVPWDDPALEAWDPNEWKWLRQPDRGKTIRPGAMLRCQGRQKYSYWIAGLNGHWKTDSGAWAWIFHVAAQGEPIGELLAGDGCMFDVRAWRLPPSLVRWWLHWGGGCLSVLPTGQVVLCGTGVDVDWGQLAGWMRNGDPKAGTGRSPDVALARRKLALGQRLANRRRGPWPPHAR